ncbi:Hypothetical predicted protein [Xyrichtys novacula]|uniref:Uncharacterized protein n=1 Tax=Xyrichtys novacula TaxID=13765 RepID=A0AAV1FP06_XYRNO|nr:Hypothetical predicted protein [Xyrichtys novacula]
MSATDTLLWADTALRLPAGVNLKRGETEEEEEEEVVEEEGYERTQREGHRGPASTSSGTTYVFCPFQVGCYTVPIPDIPEAAWLATGSEWLILEQHVLHSSNHLSQPQAKAE